jgi:hypothetical protein
MWLMLRWRRVCPGRFFADDALWAAIVSILSIMEIAKAKDDDGKEINVKPEFTSGLTMLVILYFSYIRDWTVSQ